MTYFEEVQKRVESSCSCKAEFDRSDHVTETFGSRVVWDGDVQVYRLLNHPTAKFCYAWGHPIEKEPREITTVLGLPPVDSSIIAVRVAIAAKSRST